MYEIENMYMFPNNIWKMQTNTFSTKSGKISKHKKKTINRRVGYSDLPELRNSFLKVIRDESSSVIDLAFLLLYLKSRERRCACCNTNETKLWRFIRRVALCNACGISISRTLNADYTRSKMCAKQQQHEGAKTPSSS